MYRRPHQTWQFRRRFHADPHYEAPERRQRVQTVGHDAARGLYGQEAGEQRPAQDIDAERAGHHVKPARAIVHAEHLVAAGIAAFGKRSCDAIGERCCITQAEIKPLRADRRQHVARFADKRRARSDQTLRRKPRDGEMGTGPHLADAAEQPVKPASERRFESRQLLFQAGDPAERVYLVLKGRVKIYQVAENGKEIILDIVGRGDIVGDMAIVEDGERTACAQALDDTVALSISWEDFAYFLQQSPRLGFAMLELTARRLAGMQRSADRAPEQLDAHPR